MPPDGQVAAAPSAAPASRPSFLNWLREGLRTLLFFRPRWDGVRASPGTIAWLVLLEIALSIGIGRLFITGPAAFNWRAGLAGWASFVLVAWACYALRSRSISRDDGTSARACTATAPDAAHLLTLLVAQGLFLLAVWGPVSVVLTRTGALAAAGDWAYWALWLAPVTWGTLAQLTALMRAGDNDVPRRVQAVYAIIFATALNAYLAPNPQFWRQLESQEAEETLEPISFTQDVVDLQSELLQAQLDALKPQRAGVADMYTLTFAPYEGEEVFRRESRMVNEVMAKRFDAAGRGLQMLNHREHVENMPWATPLNLQRAIDGLAGKMDLDEDVLFIHLTSHGARNGELAPNFLPLDVDPVTPAELREWLDEAGIRHRVISISACYSGSWVAPLANDDTLVMTAADADHTSYGCGRKSELTFFGRAVFDEQLRKSTRSFEAAHAAARKVIATREKEAGKDDGYSNPQIKVGSRIRTRLDEMRVRLEN